MDAARDPDIITSADLPGLRAEMIAHTNDLTVGDEFRAACDAVIAAIDQARDDDAATHAPLESSLHAFVAAGNAEIERGTSICKLFRHIGKADDVATVRGALAELVALLPGLHVWLVAMVVADALDGDLGSGIEYGLAEMPIACEQLH